MNLKEEDFGYSMFCHLFFPSLYFVVTALIMLSFCFHSSFHAIPISYFDKLKISDSSFPHN